MHAVIFVYVRVAEIIIMSDLLVKHNSNMFVFDRKQFSEITILREHKQCLSCLTFWNHSFKKFTPVKKICTTPIISNKSQYRGTEVGMSSQMRNSKSMFSVWNRRLTANWRYDCHSVVSSRSSEPPHRMLAWLSQHMSMAQRDAEHRWIAETASSLGIVGVCRFTVEQKLTKPCVRRPLSCTGCTEMTML